MTGGIVAHVGRKGLRFALTDGDGALMADSMRLYGTGQSSSVSGALTAFQRDLSLPRLPERMAVAVAGLARGDAISITHTRWFVSRPGLQAMLGRTPLILNDFEAEAWALGGSASVSAQPVGAAPPLSLRAPGTYCIIGMTSGLGVSVLVRDATGGVTVLATEAGHGAFAPASAAMADLAGAMFRDRRPVVAEHMISATGLIAIYNHLATEQRLPRQTDPEAITRRCTTDPLSRQACEIVAEAFWSHVGSLVLSYGAWDGVIVMGGLASALRSILGSRRMDAVFAGNGKYARLLAAVPRGFVTLEHGELHGAAEALRRSAA